MGTNGPSRRRPEPKPARVLAAAAHALGALRTPLARRREKRRGVRALEDRLRAYGSSLVAPPDAKQRSLSRIAELYDCVWDDADAGDQGPGGRPGLQFASRERGGDV